MATYFHKHHRFLINPYCFHFQSALFKAQSTMKPNQHMCFKLEMSVISTVCGVSFCMNMLYSATVPESLCHKKALLRLLCILIHYV